jgi:hypothetical protein
MNTIDADPHRQDGVITDTMISPTSNEAFAEHLLSLLALVVPPHGTTPHPAQYPDEPKVDELLSRHHSKSQAELQVEKAVLELGTRLRDAEWQLAMSGQGHSAAGRFSLFWFEFGRPDPATG